MTYNVNTRQSQVLFCVAKVAQKYRKHYSTVSLSRIIELLARFYGVNISYSTIKRDIKNLLDDGMILRQRRTYKQPNGLCDFATSMTHFTYQAIMTLRRSGTFTMDFINKLLGMVQKFRAKKQKAPLSLEPSSINGLSRIPHPDAKLPPPGGIRAGLEQVKKILGNLEPDERYKLPDRYRNEE